MEVPILLRETTPRSLFSSEDELTDSKESVRLCDEDEALYYYEEPIQGIAIAANCPAIQTFYIEVFTF